MEQAKRSPRFERKPKEESENRRTDKTLWRKYRSGAKPGFSTRLPGRGRAYFDRDLNRIHSEWQHKRAANLPNLLHQRGTRGLSFEFWTSKELVEKKKRTKKKERKKGYFHRDEKPPHPRKHAALGFHARRRGLFLNVSSFSLCLPFNERGNARQREKLFELWGWKERTCDCFFFFWKGNRAAWDRDAAPHRN